MSVWIGKIECWLQQQVRAPEHPPEPDEVVRDAALLRSLAVFSVVLLVVSTLFARVVFSQGDDWSALLLGGM